MDKKGTSFSGWVEGILLSILFVAILGIVIGNMNSMYEKDNQLLGINVSEESFGEYGGSATTEIKTGEIQQVSEGFTLKSGWSIMKSLFSTILSFISGSFITTAFGYMNLPAQVGLIFRLLYIISMILIILRALFKVKI